MGKKMAGTNEFAFFRCKSICTGGGVQNQAEKNSKNAFRPVPVQKSFRPVPVQKITFPVKLTPMNVTPKVTMGNEIVTVHKFFWGELIMDHSYSFGRAQN